MSERDIFYDASSESALLACTASAWQGDKARCRWCDGELPGRRRRWCSQECADNFGRNHWWSWASKAAMKRDGYMCIECRVDPRAAKETALATGLPAKLAHRYIVLQVHHRTPVLGRHGVSGCHHHLDGLETVCLHHHLERHHGPQEHQLALGDAA